MKHIFVTILVCFSLIGGVPNVRAESLGNVGRVRTSGDLAPDGCYELLRDGKSLRPLVQDMYVLNGDVIVPYKGRHVTLIYNHTGCGEKGKVMVNKRMTVHCDPREFATAGGFMDLLPEVVKKFLVKSRRKAIVKTRAETTKGEQEADRSCFPKDIRLSPWPLEGSTGLYGSPICFRWTDEGKIRSCSKARLVIRGGADGPVVQEMKTGELFCLNDKLHPGTSYNWHIESGEGSISGDHHFRMLGKGESDNIRSQLAEVANIYAGQCPGLMQALYLQFVSDAVPGLDLYADSFQLMRESGPCQEEVLLRDKLFQRLLLHAGRTYGEHPIEVRAVLMHPVPKPPVLWTEIGKTVDKGSSIKFVLKNRSSDERAARYCCLLHIAPDGSVRPILPLPDKNGEIALKRVDDSLDLRPEGSFTFGDSGRNSVVLMVMGEPMKISLSERAENAEEKWYASDQALGMILNRAGEGDISVGYEGWAVQGISIEAR